MTSRAKSGTARRVLDDAPAEWSVDVIGDPVPQGSKNAPAAGRVVEVAGKRLKDWRHDIAWQAKAARNAAGLWAPATGPVRLVVAFRLKLPRDAHPDDPAVTTPDTDKALRACLDAMTSVAYDDDRQVVDVHATKRYADPATEHPGVTISVRAGALRRTA